jgi:hypothetical protein
LSDGQKSSKYKFFARGTGSTASGGVYPGYGYISVNPFALGVNNQTTFGAIWVSNATNTLNTIGTTAGAGNTVVNTNSPFTISQLGTSAGALQYKLVSACVRVREVSTNMNRGGRIIGLCHPLKASVNGKSADQLMASEQAFRVPLGDEWVELKYTGPADDTDSSYQIYNTATNGTISDFFMGLLITSSIANSEFDYEVYVNVEFIGQAGGATAAGGTAATPLAKTPSGVDPVGANIVVTAMQESRMEAGSGTHDGAKGFKLLVRRKLLEVAKRAFTAFAPAIGGAAGAMVGGAGALPGRMLGSAAAAAVNSKIDKKINRLKAKEKQIKNAQKAAKAAKKKS